MHHGSRLFVLPAILASVFWLPSAAQESGSRLLDSLVQRSPLLLPNTLEVARRADSLLRRGKLPRDTADTLRRKDTTAVDTGKAARAERSVYERLFQGHLANPDSLLDKLQVFGQEVFGRRQATVRDISGAEAAVPAGYPVGPGDEVSIMLWGRINEQYRLKVDRNGVVNVPHIGPVTVGGLPFDEMQSVVAKRLEAIEGVQASVTLGELRSIQVYVIGEVAAPGLYTLSALSNVTSALFAAGGPTRMGSLRSIELRRSGQMLKRLDFYEFLLHGADPTRVRLQPGDVVFVPIVKRMAAVTGNVRRSAIFEITQGATLPEVIDLAGGVTPGGWVNRIQIERIVDNAYQTVLDVNAVSVDSIPRFAVRDGDLVKVFPVVNTNERMVTVEGNVKRPGKYALRDRMRLSDILSSYDVLKPETYFIYAVIERYDPPSYLARIIPFNLQNVLESPGSDGDKLLQSRDRIIIYHRDYFEPDRSVSIEGAITTPGRYKLLDNMRVRDLILQAGGLREDASMYRGELYRRRFDVDTVSTAKVDFNVMAAMQDDSAFNMLLQRFDRVFVRQKRGWEEQKSVTLSGEFVYPGTYVVFEGETLEKLIERAGGFTRNAYLTAAILTRPSVRKLEKQRLDEYVGQLERDITQTGAMAAAEAATPDLQTLMNQQMQVLAKLRATEPVGRVVIDLNDRKSLSSLLLEDGDVLLVPRNVQTVSVIGEVYNPATFRYDEGRNNARYYIDMSGGLKPMARRGDVYVIRANGSVVSDQMANIMHYTMMPGDVVVAPQKLSYSSRYRRFSNILDSVLKLTTIASNSAATIMAIKVANQ